MSKKSQDVVPKEGKWAVKGAENRRDTSHRETQIGGNISKSQGSEVVIRGRDGQFRSQDRGGSDTTPPRDKVEQTKVVGSNTARISLPEIKKAITSLRPADQTAIRQWMDSKGQRKQAKPKSPPQWPDFEARQKAIFGNRTLQDSQAVLDDVRGDRF